MSDAAEISESSLAEMTASSRRAAVRTADAARTFETQLRAHADHPRLTALIDHAVSEGLLLEFAAWDEKAKEFQSDHRRLVGRVLWAGFVGAILGVVLSVLDSPDLALTRAARLRPFLGVLELCAFGYAGFSVWRGLRSSRRDRWLLARYEAERRRLQFFELASSPAIWRERPPADWGAYVRAGMDTLPHITEAGVEGLTHAESAPELVDPRDCPTPGRRELTALVQFYRVAHLDVQMDYFELKARGGAASRTLHKQWVAYFFFGLILTFAVLHGVIALIHHFRPISHGEIWAVAALSISALVAGVWTAIRTWRSANEFVRNTSRAEARLEVLREHCRRLETELAKLAPDSWTIFMTLRLCDAVLRGDQREWLSLMHEAEWF